MTTEYRMKALLNHLNNKYLGDIQEDDLSESTYDHNTFEYSSEEYKVLTCEEREHATREYILDSLWAFNPEFLISHMDNNLTAKHIKHMQELYEDANEPLKALIKDLDHFVDDAILSDGYGHFLSSYDGEEHEEKIVNTWYYIYRVN